MGSVREVGQMRLLSEIVLQCLCARAVQIVCQPHIARIRATIALEKTIITMQMPLRLLNPQLAPRAPFLNPPATEPLLELAVVR